MTDQELSQAIERANADIATKAYPGDESVWGAVVASAAKAQGLAVSWVYTSGGPGGHEEAVFSPL